MLLFLLMTLLVAVDKRGLVLCTRASQNNFFIKLFISHQIDWIYTIFNLSGSYTPSPPLPADH